MNRKANMNNKQKESSIVTEVLRRQSPTGTVSLDKKIKTPE